MFLRFVYTVFLAISMVFFNTSAFAGKVELTTYYPSPYGEYKNLQTTEGAHFGTTLGNVGIGVAANTTPTAKLEVVGDGKFSGPVTVGGNLSATGATITGAATVTGSVTASAFYYSSDMRLKENIVPVTGSLEKIARLKGVNFNFKDLSTEKHLGLIAQDVEPVVPEVVRTQAKGMKSVDYAALTALLIEGIKAQQKEISDLKSRIVKLESSNIQSVKPLKSDLLQ